MGVVEREVSAAAIGVVCEPDVCGFGEEGAGVVGEGVQG
jgi:hypothetical protein